MRYFSLLLLCFLLTACSQTQQGIGDTISVAIFGSPDVQLSDQQIRDMPYANMYARINDGSRIFVVLAFAENGQLKWLTQDRAMLVTQNGRLVKTTGLENNLNEVSDLQHDPLLKAKSLVEGAKWTRTLTWTQDKQLHMVTANSVFHLAGTEPLTILGITKTYQLVEENVEVPELNTRYRNRFWIDLASGAVSQAEQYVGPEFFPVEITILNPYTR